MEPGKGRGRGEKQGQRRRDNCTTEQSARLYHKFDNTRGSDCAQARVVELVDNARAGRLWFLSVER